MKVFADASLFIYLNVPVPESEARAVELFWESLLGEHEVYTNFLVLDEVVYVSKKRYGVGYAETFEFVERAVLPYVELLPVGPELYPLFRLYTEHFGLKPSDAIHAATVKRYRLDAVASEDSDFDKAGIPRLWLSKRASAP